MLAIQCKLCGGDIELAPNEQIGTCAYCGNANTFPKTEDEEKILRFNRANNLRRNGEFDKAMKIYQKMLEEDPNDAELHWCCSLARFGVIYHEDPVTFEWVPDCHRTSVENFLEDADYLAAVNGFQGIEQRRCQQDAEKIADVEREIRQIAQEEEPFDLFISCRETDDSGQRTVESILAKGIYDHLTRQGYRVFFAHETLSGKTKSEPYIYAALNTARAMIVFGERRENLLNPWVKNEVVRFHQLSAKKKEKVVAVCYRDMSVEELPGFLKNFPAFDAGDEDFKKNLFEELNKVMPKKISLDSLPDPEEPLTELVFQEEVPEPEQQPEKKPEPRRARVQKPAPRPKITIAELLQRGYRALAEQKWQMAKKYFDDILLREPDNGRANFGQFLAEREFIDDKDFAQKIILKMESLPGEDILFSCDIDKEIDEAVREYKVSHYLEEDQIREIMKFSERYTSHVKAKEAYYEQMKQLFETDERLVRACGAGGNDFGAAMRTFLQNILNNLAASVNKSKESAESDLARLEQDYEKHVREKRTAIEDMNREALAKRDEDYNDACTRMTEAKSLEEFWELSKIFESFAGYKNSEKFKAHCDSKVLHAESAGKRRKRKKILVGFACAAGVAAILAVIFLPRYIRYQNAVGMFEEGSYESAVEAFGRLGTYLSSDEKKAKSMDKWIEQLETQKDYDRAQQLIGENYSGGAKEQMLQHCYVNQANSTEADTATNVATLEKLQEQITNEKTKGDIQEKLDGYYYQMGNESAQGGNFNTAIDFYKKVTTAGTEEAEESKRLLEKAMKEPLYAYVEGVTWKLVSCVSGGKASSKDATGFAGVHARLMDDRVVFYFTFARGDIDIKSGGSLKNIKVKGDGASYTLDFDGKNLTIRGKNASGKAVVSQLKCKQK